MPEQQYTLRHFPTYRPRMIVDPVMFDVKMYMTKEEEDGYYIAKDFVWVKYEPGMSFPGNEIVGMDNDMCQKIMNLLWERGYRPTGSQQDFNAETKALKNHIDDLRKICFAQMAVDEVNRT